MRRALIIAPLLVVFAACSTGPSDYKSQTEDFINDDSRVEDLFDGADVSDATCEEPSDTEIGTRYSCTADVVGTGQVDFDGLIDAEDSFAVVPSQ